jgi:Holliday junction resolvasome RuvABC ATP-dependent DNA helicase subunit
MIDFEPYSPLELGDILKLRAPDIQFTSKSLKKLQEIVRDNARSAVMRAREVELYCESKNSPVFNVSDYDSLCDQLGILSHGISATEKQILDILEKSGQCTLTVLSAKTGLSPSALRKHHEVYLLKRGLMQIDGKRKITQKGRDLIYEIHKN